MADAKGSAIDETIPASSNPSGLSPTSILRSLQPSVCTLMLSGGKMAEVASFKMRETSSSVSVYEKNALWAIIKRCVSNHGKGTKKGCFLKKNEDYWFSTHCVGPVRNKRSIIYVPMVGSWSIR